MTTIIPNTSTSRWVTLSKTGEQTLTAAEIIGWEFWETDGGGVNGQPILIRPDGTVAAPRWDESVENYYQHGGAAKDDADISVVA